MVKFTGFEVLGYVNLGLCQCLVVSYMHVYHAIKYDVGKPQRQHCPKILKPPQLRQ